ncbi:MAG: copper homeostasis protein CutC [Cyclobacteriaceae bacterium]
MSESKRKSNGRIIIMPGSGVNENTVEEIVKKTGVDEIHFSATAFRESEMKFKNESISGMGDDSGTEFKLRTVDPERVKTMRLLAEKIKT